MIVILDSNILISALLYSRSPPYFIYKAWQENIFELATCYEQMEEIRCASRYPKFRDQLKPHRVGRMMNNLQQAIVVEELYHRHETSDPHDNWMLDLAEEVSADYIVTGDKKSGLLQRKKIGKTKIISATSFCKKIS